jgi:hypothetical protein
MVWMAVALLQWLTKREGGESCDVDACLPPEVDEELYIPHPERSSVVWRAVGAPVPHQIFRLPCSSPYSSSFTQAAGLIGSGRGACGGLQQALWATFPNLGKCVCVLKGAEVVVVISPQGHTFEVALPCQAARLWALGGQRGGVLIQPLPNDTTAHNGATAG